MSAFNLINNTNQIQHHAVSVKLITYGIKHQLHSILLLGYKTSCYRNEVVCNGNNNVSYQEEQKEGVLPDIDDTFADPDEDMAAVTIMSATALVAGIALITAAVANWKKRARAGRAISLVEVVETSVVESDPVSV